MDETVRADLVERGELHTGGSHPDMRAVPHRQHARLCAIIETHGWPGRSLLGEDGCRTAGFVVQHAILNPERQRRGVALLTEAVTKREAEPCLFALLTDRVLMQEGKPQISGTQESGAAKRGVEPWPIANPETVDERRHAVG